MQEVSIMSKEGESGACDKATKGIAKGEASTPCKGRSIGKKVEKNRREGDGMCDQATRSTARIKEEFSGRIGEKSRGTLWQRSTRRSMPTGVRMVYRGSNSNVCAV